MKRLIQGLLATSYLFLLPIVSFAIGAGGSSSYVLPPAASDGGLTGSANTSPGGANTAPGGANTSPGGANTAPGGAASSGQLQNPLNDTSICMLFKDVLNIVIQLAIPIIVLFLVYSGFQFVTARGNSAALQKAKQNLFYTILGIGLFLGAWTLASILVGTINTLQPGSVSSC